MVTVAGFPFGAFSVTTMDQDNLMGVSAADLGAMIYDVLTVQTTPGLYLARTDYDNDGDDDSADIGMWLNVYLNDLIVPAMNGPSCGDPGFGCCALIP